jgi:hypothetical protein
MAVRMPYGHLSDYATVDTSGKLIIAGLFEIIYAPEPDAEVVGILFSLVARLECSIADGLQHDIKIRFVDGEEELVGDELPVGTITFTPTGPGRPYAANVMARVAGLKIRGVDDYRFVILVDDRPVGSIPVYVQLAPEAPGGV